MDEPQVSPREILSRQRKALKIVIEESKEAEKKRLAHLLSLHPLHTVFRPQSGLNNQQTRQLSHQITLSGDFVHDLSGNHQNKDLGSKDIFTAEAQTEGLSAEEIKRIAAIERQFNIERVREQDKIQRLFEDYAALKKAFLNNKVDLTARKEQQKEKIKLAELKSPSKLPLHRSRFAGLQTQGEHDFHRLICKKFDEDFEKQEQCKMKAALKFDQFEERNKLKLLKEKKEILTKMITLQYNELSEGKEAIGQASVRWPRAASSIGGRTQTSTGESWATFGPGLRKGVVSVEPKMKRPSIVPQLKL